MRVLRIIGIIVLVLGGLLIGSFFSTNINPDVTAANFGVLALVLGTLILGADFFKKRARSVYQTSSGAGRPVLVTFGWTILSAGLLISLLGFLLENQVMCSCPATGSCVCGVLLYSLMFGGGLVAALIGAGIIVGGSIFSRRRKLTEPPTIPIQRVRSKMSNRRIGVLAVALTIIVVFALFSIWPGVYVTSVNEQGYGIPPPPIMTSQTSEPGSGFELSIGGSFSYILHFNYSTSYPEYKIEQISTNFGFSIAHMNATLPLTVSPSNPSVTIVLNVRGPFYPYYGEASILMNIGTVQNNNTSG